MHKGLLDLLDQADLFAGQFEYDEPHDRSRDRRNRNRAQNIRATIQEIRRRIERAGQETKT